MCTAGAVMLTPALTCSRESGLENRAQHSVNGHLPAQRLSSPGSGTPGAAEPHRPGLDTRSSYSAPLSEKYHGMETGKPTQVPDINQEDAHNIGCP